MDAALLIARLLLAGVFAVAGTAKLADLPGSRSAVAGFGVPERLASPLGTALPFAELAIAALLLPAGTATAAGFAALAVLTLFSAGIAASIARGESPDCHCFGQLHSEPAGPRTLARNLILAGLAAFVAFAGMGSQPGLWEEAGALSAGTWVALGGGLVLVLVLVSGSRTLLSLLRRNGNLLLRVEALEAALIEHDIPIPDAPEPEPRGLPVGSRAPKFELPGIDGDLTSLDSLLSAGRPALLVFTSPHCGPCEALMPKVATWQRDLGGQFTVAVIADGSPDENAAKLQTHGLRNVLIQAESDVAGSYDARATPSALVIGPDGRISSALALGTDSISDLVAESTDPRTSRGALVDL